MRPRVGYLQMFATLVIVAAVSLIGNAQDGRGGGRGGGRGAEQGPPPPKDVVAPAIPGVVAAGTHIELVAYPVAGTEGPIRVLDGSGVLWTERNVSHISKIDLNGNRSTFVESAEGANGLGWDSKGRLLAVLRPSSGEKVAVLYPPASVATLADKVDGKPFNALNDLIVSTKDDIYFTDTQGIYFLRPGGQVKKVVDLKNMNGVVLSSDEKTLYANHKDGEYILAFDVQPDGSLKNQRQFVQLPVAGGDGMTVDAEGRLYVTAGAGVHVVSPEGKLLGTIPAPYGLITVAFAGKDKKTMYGISSLIDANRLQHAFVFTIPMQASGYKGRAK